MSSTIDSVMKDELDGEEPGPCFNYSLNYAGGQIPLVKDFGGRRRIYTFGLALPRYFDSGLTASVTFEFCGRF